MSVAPGRPSLDQLEHALTVAIQMRYGSLAGQPLRYVSR
jgi:hypothetical protein